MNKVLWQRKNILFLKCHQRVGLSVRKVGMTTLGNSAKAKLVNSSHLPKLWEEFNWWDIAGTGGLIECTQTGWDTTAKKSYFVN